MTDTRQERSQADGGALYSGAQSFLSYLEKGVDPRTGTYHMRVSLPKLAMNALTGPDLALSLGFDALQNADVGLGRGWSWGMSRLSPDAKRLSLADGETQLAIIYDNRIEFPDMKLPTFVAQKSGDIVTITYRSGRRERLQRFDSQPLSPYVPIEIISPQGRSIHLAWEHFEGHPMLVSIADHEQRELLRASRTLQAATITLAGPGGNAIDFRMLLSGDLVTSIELPIPGQVAWRLRYSRYTAADLAMLTEVSSPTGSVETIVYDDRGHAFPLRLGEFPDKEPERLPYVVRHVLDPGAGQPHRVTTYTYSTHNFLGFEAGVDWEDAYDALYKVTHDYRYSSTESKLDADGRAQVAIYREYDRFHATRIERRTEGDCEQTQLTDFHDETGKSWYEQPAIVGLIKQRTVRYRRGGVSRDDVTTYTYDAWGNTTEEMGPDGIAERTTYYAPAGEDGCPPDPIWATPRTVKTTVMVPSTLIERTANTKADTVTTRYRYALLPSMAPQAPGYLECSQQTLETPDGVQKTITYEYEDNVLSLLLHGRLWQQVETMGGRSITTEFAYDINDGALMTDESTYTDFDDTVSQATRHESVISGQETRRENGDEIVTFVRDALGRVVEETITPKSGESAYTTTLKHTFSLAGQTGGDVSQTTTTASGVVITQHFEGTGQLVRETRMAPDVAQGAHVEVRRIDYDALGRAHREVQRDLHDTQTIAVETHFHYDNWEQQVAVEGPGGLTEHTEFDPITRVETRWTSAGEARSARVTRQMNRFEAADWEERHTVDEKLISRTAYTYDGLGRLASETDTRQRRTEYTYDFADRVIQTKLPTSDVIETGYAPHADTEEVASIRVNGIDLGQREFDGLMRVHSQTVGGRTTTWEFDADRTQPREAHIPGGEVVIYEVNPSLPSNVKSRANGGVLTDYGYDEHSGLLLHARRQTTGQPESDYTCKRYAAGNLLSETWREGDTSRSASHTWSVQGAPLTYTDVTGREHKYQYEPDTGRLDTVHCGDVTVEMIYDALGRVGEQRVTQAGQRKLTTTFTYDDAGRETLREYVAPGHPAFSIGHQYDGLDLISMRERKLGAQPMLVENFEYDARGRLILYSAVGAETAPHDPHDPSRRIELQQWEYDVLDNITSVMTWHHGPAAPPGVAEYRYENADDLTQLTSLVYEGYGVADGTQSFEYDDAGRMVVAESGYRVQYNAFDQVLSVSRGDTALAAYRYNGLDEQCIVTPAGQPPRERVFRENRLVTEIRGALSRVYLDGGAGDIDQSGALRVYAVDQKASVMQTYDAQAARVLVYSPSGYREASAALDGVPAFDGETLDPATQWLWLGNARMYSPVLARFLVPDTYSPFDGGGFNPYARIDPVNATDPSGHLPSWLSVLVSVVTSAVAITISFLTAGGLTGVGIALAVTAKAALGQVGLVAAGSATALAVAKGTTVATAVYTAAKVTLGVMGSLTATTSVGVRTTGDHETAAKLAFAGGILTLGSMAASWKGVFRTYRGLTKTRLDAGAAARQAGQDTGRRASSVSAQGRASPIALRRLRKASDFGRGRANSLDATRGHTPPTLDRSTSMTRSRKISLTWPRVVDSVTSALPVGLSSVEPGVRTGGAPVNVETVPGASSNIRTFGDPSKVPKSMLF